MNHRADIPPIHRPPKNNGRHHRPVYWTRLSYHKAACLWFGLLWTWILYHSLISLRLSLDDFSLSAALLSSDSFHAEPDVVLPMHSQFQAPADSVMRQIQNLQAKYSSCRGKTEFLRYLLTARGGRRRSSSRRQDSLQALCDQLPTTKQVAHHYGPTLPVVIGMESCAAYRETLRQLNQPPQPRISGLYNTGTNVLAQLLQHNLQQISPVGATRVQGYEVPWGKHLPPNPYRTTNLNPPDRQPPNLDAILTIVIIRDPYYWMQSMCKAPYDVRWHDMPDHRCPNLIQDINATTYGLRVRTHQTQFRSVDEYDSLADMWSHFYRQYYYQDNTSSFPRLMVRYEDIMAHSDHVAGAIRDCIGMPPSKHPFSYVMRAAKKHGDPSGFFESLRKIASDQGRHRGLTQTDRNYTRVALDAELMNIFQYKYAPLHVPAQDLNGPFPERGVPSVWKDKANETKRKWGGRGWRNRMPLRRRDRLGLQATQQRMQSSLDKLKMVTNIRRESVK